MRNGKGCSNPKQQCEKHAPVLPINLHKNVVRSRRNRLLITKRQAYAQLLNWWLEIFFPSNGLASSRVPIPCTYRPIPARWCQPVHCQLQCLDICCFWACCVCLFLDSRNKISKRTTWILRATQYTNASKRRPKECDLKKGGVGKINAVVVVTFCLRTMAQW